MTIKSTGFLKFSEIGTEAKLALLQPVAFNNIELRKLAAKLLDKSQVSALDFYGRTYGQGSGYVGADFGSFQNQAPLTVTTSAKVFGPGECSMAIFCDQPAEYRISNGEWQDKSLLGTLAADDYVEVRVTAAPTFDTPSDVTVNMGGTIKTFSVSTGASKLSYMYIKIRAINIFEDPHGTIYSTTYWGANTTATVTFTPPADTSMYVDNGLYSATNKVFSAAFGSAVVTPKVTYVYTATYPYRYIKLAVEHLASETISGSVDGAMEVVYVKGSTFRSGTDSRALDIGTLNGKIGAKLYLHTYTWIGYGAKNEVTIAFG